MGFERFVVFLSLLILVFMFLVELFLIKKTFIYYLSHKKNLLLSQKICQFALQFVNNNFLVFF